MDFDDDSLDDLLRDSSANKFKKPAINVVTDELLSNSIPQSARKEKKSALLAELFGPSSTTSFGAIESSLEDQGKTAEKFGSGNNLSTITTVEGKKTEEFSFGSYVPSSGKSSGTKSRPASSGSNSNQQTSDFFQPPSFTSVEKKSFTSDPVKFEEYPKQSMFESPKNDFTFEREPVVSTVQVPESKSEAEWSSKVHNPTPAPVVPPSLFPKPKVGATQTFKEQSQSSPASVIPFTFQQPKNQVSSEVLNVTNVAIIKEVLENFSNNFCTRLETLTKKGEGLSEITSCLVELHKCINTASQNYLNSVNTISGRTDNGDLEKRMLVLESRIESTAQENASLRARLDFVENQLRENRNESSRIKLDTETVVESHLKWMREAVNNLDNKISSHSFQSKQAGDEANNREYLLRQTQEKLLELEGKLVKSTASGQQEEILQLLKAELKWLERQKMKLKNDRANLQVFEKQIQGKLQLLDGLSAVIELYFVYYSFW